MLNHINSNEAVKLSSEAYHSINEIERSWNHYSHGYSLSTKVDRGRQAVL